METDVLIIGGGAAGLAAAYEVADKGLTVIIVEKSWSLGGHLREQTGELEYVPEKYTGLRGYELAEQLIEQIQWNSVQILLNHTLIGRYSDGHFGVSDGEKIFSIHAKKVIFATGAAEKPYIFPKWTLPGVMTAGAAQIFMNREMVKPGREMLMVGSSDFALEVSFQLHEIGVKIKGIIEKESQIAAGEQRNLDRMSQLRIPIYLESEIETLTGKSSVEKAFIHTPNEKLEIAIDLVCTEGGFIPAIEVFQMTDTNIKFVEALGGWLPAYDKQFRISDLNIYVAGDAAGITCHGGVILSGALAGIHVVDALASSPGVRERKDNLWEEMEAIETGYNSKVWQARQKHIIEGSSSNGQFNYNLPL